MRFLVFTLVVFVLAATGAWYFNWITFTVGRDTSGSVDDVNVKINRDKIKEDIDRGRKAVGAAVDEIKKEGKKDIKEQTIRGTIRDAKTDRVTLDVAGKTMTIKITGDTKVELAGRVGTASDLRVGQDVRCTYIEQSGEMVGLEVAVLAGKK